MVKHIFRYLKFTHEFGLWYSADSSFVLVGFSDADFGMCRLDSKSISGTCNFLGTSLVSWSSRKQAIVALSSTEAEYVAAASCCSQILWMKQILQDYGLSFGRVHIFVDNMSSICITKNPVLHSRTKHIDIRFHFLLDNHERGHIDMAHVPSERQTADILTNPLEQDTFARLRGELGVYYPI